MKSLMSIFLIPAFCVGILLSASLAFAVDVAPRISDKEIIESLASIRGDIENLRVEMRAEIKRLEAGQNALDKRFDDVNKRFDDVNKRFDILQWMFGIFITIALTIMGIVGKVLWNQQKKLTQIETSLEAQKEEISFLKTLIEKLQTLIEKLLPPRGIL